MASSRHAGTAIVAVFPPQVCWFVHMVCSKEQCQVLEVEMLKRLFAKRSHCKTVWQYDNVKLRVWRRQDIVEEKKAEWLNVASHGKQIHAGM